MMRKRIINQSSKELSPPDQGWLDLERLAQVEITSEDATPHRVGTNNLCRAGLAGQSTRGANDPPFVWSAAEAQAYPLSV